MMEWEGLSEFVESHSLEVMKKADELPLIWSNIVSMHDLLSCHLHTLTLILTYKYIHIRTLPHNSNFHMPTLTSLHSSHSSHPLPLHTLTHHTLHYPCTHSLISHPHYPQFEMHVKHSSLRPDMKSDLTPSLFPLLTPPH